MFILGLRGSPRKKGNSNTLLSTFLEEAESLGAITKTIDTPKVKISPCIGCGNCERKGFCSIKDAMQDIFPLFHQADVVVMATPVFFYGPTAQIKAPIDRSQTLWARKYVHKLTDPGRKWRKGFLLSVGATKGKNLFEGVELTAKYFFDAIGADYQGSLTYKEIEDLDDIKGHSTALMDVSVKAKNIVKPFIDRKKVLFRSKNDACRGQIASAFAQHYAGDKLEVQSGGSEPAEEIDPLMEKVMVEKRIDVAFRKPKSIEKATPSGSPDLIIDMGLKTAAPPFPEVPVEEWNIEEPEAKNLEAMRQVRDAIEEKVKDL